MNATPPSICSLLINWDKCAKDKHEKIIMSKCSSHFIFWTPVSSHQGENLTRRKKSWWFLQSLDLSRWRSLNTINHQAFWKSLKVETYITSLSGLSNIRNWSSDGSLNNEIWCVYYNFICWRESTKYKKIYNGISIWVDFFFLNIFLK